MNNLKILQTAERQAMVRTLREHPHWTLAEVGALIKGGPRELASVTVRELLNPPKRGILAGLGSCPCDNEAKPDWTQVTGAAFDELVLEALGANPSWVGASYLRSRVGGPRWKLQASLQRLIQANKVERTGTTSRTRYKVIEGCAPLEAVNPAPLP